MFLRGAHFEHNVLRGILTDFKRKALLVIGLNTDNANVAAEISGKQVVELPLNLRNVFGLVTLNSSVNNGTQGQVLNGGGEQGTADQDISFFNFGGGFFGSSAFLLDGAWDTADGWGGVVYVPSVDK